MRGIHTSTSWTFTVVFVSHLIKASDDLIQQSEAVHSFMFDLLLLEILVEPVDGSEHDTHFIIGLRVELLQCVGPRYLDR